MQARENTNELNESISENRKSSEKALKISVIKNTPPYSIQLDNDVVTGLYVEFWRLWSKYSGREVEFIARDFVTNMQDLKKGRVDFHAGLNKSEERETWAQFSLPIHRVETGLFFVEENFPISKLGNMSGKTVAVRKASYQAAFFSSKYPDVSFSEFTNNEHAIKGLLDGKYAAMIAEVPHLETLLASRGLKRAIVKSSEELLSNQVFALIPNGREHLTSLINEGIKNIPINEIVELENKWISSSEPFFNRIVHPKLSSLTINEIEWIRDNQELIVGSDPKSAPIEFFIENEFLGVAIDYLNLIEETLNILFKREISKSGDELIPKIKAAKVDLLSAVSFLNDNENDMVLTEPYVSFPIVVMVRPNSISLSSISELRDAKVAAIKSEQMDKIIGQYEAVNIQHVSNTSSGLASLLNGEIDAYIGNHYMISHYLDLLNASELKVGLFTSHSLSMRMGVHDSKKKLVSILNKIFNQVSNKERTLILNQWKGDSVVEVNDEFKQFVKYAIPFVIIIFAMLFYVIFINKRMNSEIAVRRKNENNLNSEKVKLEQANRAKDEFLANMSHELRSPMNAILGTAFLFKQTTLDSSQVELVETIDDSATDLLYLINNILDLSKSEAGKLRLENAPFSIAKLCDELKERFSSAIFSNQSKNLTLEDSNKLDLTIESDVPEKIIGDSYRIKQLLSNVIMNGFKFSKGKGVELSVSLAVSNQQIGSKNRAGITVVFAIRDHGSGMSSEQVDNLFTDFNQADTSLTREQSGAGLGLKLTSQLVNLMSGSIDVDSTPNNGSLFSIMLPLGRVAGESAISPNKFQGMKILVVDDNPINLMVAKKVLENSDFVVTTVSSGIDALDKLVSCQYDTILMDIQMPEMDGMEVTKRIRTGLHQNNVPIFAISSSNSDKDRKLAIESGMNGYLRKPIEVDQIMSEISNALN